MAKCQLILEQKRIAKSYRAKLSRWKRLIGYCPCCNRYFRWPITTERRLTQYCEESNNYMTACKECHIEDYDYYSELWREYNAGRL